MAKKYYIRRADIFSATTAMKKTIISTMLAASMVASMCTPVLANEGIHMTYSDNKLTIYSTESATATLVHAAYDNERMTGLGLYDGISLMEETSYSIEADEDDKFILWDSLTGMKPLCDALVVTSVTPSESPTTIPTDEPTAIPTSAPTAEPTATPSPTPTAEPTIDDVKTLEVRFEGSYLYLCWSAVSGATHYAVYDKDGTLVNLVPSAANTTGYEYGFKYKLEADYTFTVKVIAMTADQTITSVGKTITVTAPTPSPTPEPIPDPDDYKWEVSKAYASCPVNTELMTGLFTLFADTRGTGEYITSTDNGKWNGNVASGTALKYVAWSDGVLTIDFNVISAGKPVYVREEGSGSNTIVSIKTDSTLSGMVKFDVKKDFVYYIYAEGTKLRFTSASFEEGISISTPSPSPSPTPGPELKYIGYWYPPNWDSEKYNQLEIYWNEFNFPSEEVGSYYKICMNDVNLVSLTELPIFANNGGYNDDVEFVLDNTYIYVTSFFPDEVDSRQFALDLDNIRWLNANGYLKPGEEVTFTVEWHKSSSANASITFVVENLPTPTPTVEPTATPTPSPTPTPEPTEVPKTINVENRSTGSSYYRGFSITATYDVASFDFYFNDIYIGNSLEDNSRDKFWIDIVNDEYIFQILSDHYDYYINAGILSYGTENIFTVKDHDNENINATITFMMPAAPATPTPSPTPTVEPTPTPTVEPTVEPQIVDLVCEPFIRENLTPSFRSFDVFWEITYEFEEITEDTEYTAYFDVYLNDVLYNTIDTENTFNLWYQPVNENFGFSIFYTEFHDLVAKGALNWGVENVLTLKDHNNPEISASVTFTMPEESVFPTPTPTPIPTSGECGDNAIWTFDEETGTLTISGEGAIWDSTMNNSAYDYSWYYLDIKELIIEKGITHIGENFLYYHEGVSKIIIEDGLISIGDNCFNYLVSLTEIRLPNSITSIGMAFLTESNAITEIILPSSLTDIDIGLCGYCTSIKTIYVPTNLLNYYTEVEIKKNILDNDATIVWYDAEVDSNITTE